MSPSPVDRLKHIRDECELLIRHVLPLSEADFLSAPLTPRAAERCIEIIGEASKHLPQEVRGRMPDVEWTKAARMRDRLAHHYFATLSVLVFETVRQRIEPLHAEVSRLIDELEPNAAEPTLPGDAARE